MLGCGFESLWGLGVCSFSMSHWAEIAQWAVCWARCPAWWSAVGSNLLWISGRGDYSLGVNMGSESIPKKNLFRVRVYTEIYSAHICIPWHRLKRSWRSCPRRVNAGNKNTPSMHHPRRRNVATSIAGLINLSHTQKSHPKNDETQRYSWERRRRSLSVCLSVCLFVSLSVYASVSVCVCACVSLCLRLCPPVYVCVCVSVSMYGSVCDSSSCR